MLISQDGGQTFEGTTPVNTAWRHERIKTSNFNYLPQMAADTRSREFRDRLYCVWKDGSGYSQVRIFLSYSADKGKSWSAPLMLSEQPAGSTGDGDYCTFMPSVAVNQQGVTAVSWYDCRGMPQSIDDAKKIVGCNMAACGRPWTAAPVGCQAYS